MVTRSIVVCILIPFLFGGCGTGTSNADESSEPPLNYSLTIGEKTLTISEGERVPLEGTYNNPLVSVTPYDFRVFPYQGVTFKYPRSFTFEADLEDASAKIWTLSGNDFKIMVFVLGESIASADFAQQMIEEFGSENAEVADADAKITLGDHELSGTSIRVTLASHVMAMDIYRLPSRDLPTKLLVFQDSLDDAGTRSKESEKTIAEIKGSFAIGP